MHGEPAGRKGELVIGDVLDARGNVRIYQRFIGEPFRASLGEAQLRSSRNP